MRLRTLGLALAWAVAGTAQAAEHHQAPTSSGEPVEVFEDLPSGSGPFPTVVFANGQAGDVNGQLPLAMSNALVKRGIAVVRFDWRYRTADPKAGVQSSTLANEVADMKAALAFVRSDRRLNNGSVVIMAKSLGTMITTRVLPEAPEVRGAVLLTPLCSLRGKPGDPAWMSDPYPGFASERRPVAFVLGDSDSFCETKTLYEYATHMSGPVRIDVVDGGHGFGVRDYPEGDALNLSLAAEAAANAAAAMVRTSGGAR